MFPLRDENPTNLTPWVSVGLIAANVVVWLYLQGGGLNEDALARSVCSFGTIPAELTGQMGGFEGIELGEGLPPCRFGGLTHATAVTGMFLHGSWVHLLGNMWFLWLFGNNVEDSMGHMRFLVFYLLCGLAGVAAHVFMGPASPVPTVGASGAISGVMGGYLLLYPRVRIQTVFLLVFIIRIIAVPAWFVLILWFLLQLFSGWSEPMAAGGGVAFWAHVGGFAAGVVLVKLFEDRALVAAHLRTPRGPDAAATGGPGWV